METRRNLARRRRHHQRSLTALDEIKANGSVSLAEQDSAFGAGNLGRPLPQRLNQIPVCAKWVFTHERAFRPAGTPAEKVRWFQLMDWEYVFHITTACSARRRSGRLAGRRFGVFAGSGTIRGWLGVRCGESATGPPQYLVLALCDHDGGSRVPRTLGDTRTIKS